MRAQTSPPVAASSRTSWFWSFTAKTALPAAITGETAPSGRIDALVSARTDPVSGQPESKASAVAIRPFAARAFVFAVSAKDFRPEAPYWALARGEGGWRAEMALREVPQDWETAAKELFGLPGAEVVTAFDPTRGIARVALVEAGRVRAALFAAPEPVALSRSHVAAMIGSEDPGALLAGRAGGARPDPGPIVCACLSVGLNTILHGIETQGLMTVVAIGEALGAGVTCGSCRPELARILKTQGQRAAAE